MPGRRMRVWSGALLIVAAAFAAGWWIPVGLWGRVVIGESMRWGEARLKLRRVILVDRSQSRAIPPVEPVGAADQEKEALRRRAYHFYVLPNMSLCVHTEGWFGQRHDEDRIVALWVGREHGFGDEREWLSQRWDFPLEVDLTNRTLERWLVPAVGLVGAGIYVRRFRRRNQEEQGRENEISAFPDRHKNS